MGMKPRTKAPQKSTTSRASKVSVTTRASAASRTTRAAPADVTPVWSMGLHSWLDDRAFGSTAPRR